MKTIMFCALTVISGAIVVGCQAPPEVPTASSPSAPPVASPASQSSPATSPAIQEASFSEPLYLFANPDVKDMIKQGKYKSGLDHYTQVGQTAKKPDGEAYESFFMGSSGNDKVQGFGKGDHAHFSGVEIEIVTGKDDPFPLRPKSLGKGEMDVLVGTTEGGNEFLLGSFITAVNPKAEPFYVGGGEADYARIQNFTPGKDGIILAGTAEQYKIEPREGNVQISTIEGDLVAIVEGVEKLTVGEVVKDYGIFTLK